MTCWTSFGLLAVSSALICCGESSPPEPPRLGEATPSSPVRLPEQRASACVVRLEVDDIVDPDSSALRARLVVDNGGPGARVLDDRALPPLPAGTTSSYSFRLDPVSDLGGAPAGSASSTVSLFVTDAPRFALDAGGPGADLGRVLPEEGRVVQTSWVFESRARGDCP